MKEILLEKEPAIEPHLSVSSINCYLRCPRQYYYRYIRKVISPPNSALTMGSTIHNALQFNYSRKLTSRRDLNLRIVQEYYSAEFDKRRVKTDWKKDENPDTLKDTGISLITKYHETVAPTVQPTYVEEPFGIFLEGIPLKFVGRLDLVDDSHNIIDHKVLSKKPSQSQLNRDYKFQLIAYKIGFSSLTGLNNTKLFVDCLTKTKVPNIIRYPIPITDEDLRRFVKMVYTIWQAIEDNKHRDLWNPNPYNFTCTVDNCGYYQTCMNEW